MQQNARALAMHGDFEMLLQVIPLLDPGDQEKSLANAISIMPCDYQSALSLAMTAARIGDAAQMSRFLTIAGAMTEDKPWAQRDLGRAILRLEGLAGSARALEMLAAAYAAGDKAAGRDMVRLLGQKGSPAYDPVKAREIEKALDLQ